MLWSSQNWGFLRVPSISAIQATATTRNGLVTAPNGAFYAIDIRNIMIEIPEKKLIIRYVF